MKKNYPKIITADKRNKDHVKAVLKLGFSSDALLRWVFPDANSFLKNFDLWMDEFSKKSFENNIVLAKKIFMEHPYGIPQVLSLMSLFFIQPLNSFQRIGWKMH